MSGKIGHWLTANLASALLLALIFSCASPAPHPATASAPQPVAAPAPKPTVATFVPVLVSSGGGPGVFLGGSRAGKWLDEEAGRKLSRADESYRLIGLTGAPGTATGAAVKGNKTIGCLEVKLRVPNPKETVVAVGGKWNPLPHQPALIKSGQAFLQEALRLARAKTLKPEGAKVGRVVRVDLDGTGPVTIFEAGNYWQPPHSSEADTFSMVGLSRPGAAVVEVAGEYYLDQDELPLLTRLVAVADLNGDGKMEIVVSHTYFEGESFTVFEMQAKRPVAVLNYGCGL